MVKRFKKKSSYNKYSSKNSKRSKNTLDFKIVPLEEDVPILKEKIGQQLDDATYIVFDIETTGGNPEKNGITEICAVKWKQGKTIDKFYSLVNPEVPIPPIVRRMTGIDNKMVRNAPKISKVMPTFIEFIENDILVSHNTIGDLKFLRYFAAKTSKHDLRNFFLCTHLLTEKLIPESKDKSLQGLTKFLGLEVTEIHRAEADAFLTKDLFATLLVKMVEKDIHLVVDAIRFQGDLDSGVRVGWAIKPNGNKVLSSSPGVISFKNREKETLFITSAIDCSKEFKVLNDFQQLPKPLLRTLLKSCEFKVQTFSHIFLAMLEEAREVSKHNLRVEPSNWHLRTVFAICIIQQEDGKLLVKMGNVFENTIYAYGPIYDKKSANKMLHKIAEIFSVKVTRNGFILDQGYLKLLKGVFEKNIQKIGHEILKSLFSWKTIINCSWRKDCLESFGFARKLMQIDHVQEDVSCILRKHGVLVISESNQSHLLFPIVGSAPLSPIKVALDWEPWLYQSSSGKVFLEDLQKEVAQFQVKPLSKAEANICKATLWTMLMRKGKFSNRTSFVPLENLN